MKIEIKKPGILYLSKAQYDIRLAVKACKRPSTHISKIADVAYSTMKGVLYGTNEPSESTKAKILGAVDKLNEMDRLNKERHKYETLESWAVGSALL